VFGDIEALFELPFMELLFRAQQAHREHFDASEVQLSTCCRSRPAAALKTAATARNRPTSTPASRPAS
jgi:biotin synthase-like enzyme